MSYIVKNGNSLPAMDAKGEFQTFEDMEVYKVARAFRRKIYGVTRRLPDFEKFELASQIRRAAVTLTNNKAELLSALSPKPLLLRSGIRR